MTSIRGTIRDRLVGAVEDALWHQQSDSLVLKFSPLNRAVTNAVDPYWGAKSYSDYEVESVTEGVSDAIHDALLDLMEGAAGGYEPTREVTVQFGELLVPNPRTAFRLIGFDPRVADGSQP
jgi:hypothetical protein